MAFEAVRTLTVIPNSGLIPRGRAVSINSSGEAALTAANALPVGITLEPSPADNQNAISIAVLDGSKVEIEANDAIDRGDPVAVAGTGTSAGRIDDTAAGAGVFHIGYALEAATAAGDLITVLLAPRASRVA